jgi:putative Mg2+ transporter-C (MgtC) family protein
MEAWWSKVWATVVMEFSDLGQVEEVTRTCVRLLMAALLGGLIGYEREKTGKTAGLRTHMLVAVGSALFVLVPLQAGTSIDDLSRVLQGIVAGIGFLCAGAIMKLSAIREVKGLTTAAGVWVTAAIGVAAGMGREMTAILSTLLVLFVLAVLRFIEPGKTGKSTSKHHDSEE